MKETTDTVMDEKVSDDISVARKPLSCGGGRRRKN